MPHAWKTGISVAVAAHLAMVTPHMPFFEFLPAELCESRLRKELVARRARLSPTASSAIPRRPGLGFELNRDALDGVRAPPRPASPERRLTAPDS